ncbi:MAG: acyltransferase [Calditrichaeota bacterium]|nr:MAG: acyltransferase [Calditrichota bacterium]
MRVGFFQFYPRFGDWEHNLSLVLKGLEQTSADLIVLPELAFSGYYFQSREEASRLAQDPTRSPIVEALIQLCRQRDFYLVTGFAEKAGERVFNSALLLGPEGWMHTYRKIHLFNEEKEWFDPGDRPLSVQTVRGVRIGMMVCFDWVFPEVARILALQGAQVLCHPSNLVLAYCQQAMLTRCLENGVFAVTANRYGEDRRPQGTLNFTGQSQIVGPKGELIFRAPPEGDCLQVVQIDPDRALDKQITARNHLLTDRRPDFYRPLCGSDRN